MGHGHEVGMCSGIDKTPEGMLREVWVAVRRMAVLNDFEANGYGVTALDEQHVVVLNDVPATEKVSVSEYQHCPAIQGCCSEA